MSDSLGFEIFGLFARESIPANSVIGNYVGFQGFGADLNHENYTYSEKHYEYRLFLEVFGIFCIHIDVYKNV